MGVRPPHVVDGSHVKKCNLRKGRGREGEGQQGRGVEKWVNGVAWVSEAIGGYGESAKPP